jgi:hypothetical protein
MDRDVRIAMRRASADFALFRGGTVAMGKVDTSGRSREFESADRGD